MQPRGSSQFPAGLRRAIAVTEFVAAGLFLLSGVDGLTMNPRRKIGGDGMGTGWWILMAWPFLLSGAVLAGSAYAAWRGGRRWWVWQAALPALWAATFVGFSIYRVFIAD